jgi:dimethylaniline monooxygenase (N-oxide forming)
MPAAPANLSATIKPPFGAQRPRVCVIGAGTSGLVSCKALRDRGVDFVCFEASDRVGGLWVFKNKNGRGGAYRSLHINTSRERMQLRDFPMPPQFPDYPGHALIARYLADYARHFELESRIRFETSVERVVPSDTGGFRVVLGRGEDEHFDAVIVGNGHHFSPRRPPRVTGHFGGLELHSHDYVSPSEPHELRGRRVVVVGFGNSAVDIASELGRANAGRDGETEGKVFLSVRRGAWVLPKYALGKPLDQVTASAPFLPRWLRRRLVELWYRLAVGDPRRFGLPWPDHDLGDAHPTMSSELFTLLGSGAVSAKPEIVAYEANTVEFADGSRERIDAIVYATGYHVSFPFFEETFVAAPDNELPLYFRVFHPQTPGLYFIGLCQPLGPIMPIAEAQAKLVAEHLAGDYALPDSATMQQVAARERERVLLRYGNSPRHTMQVDFDEYLSELVRERQAGRRRRSKSA